MEDITYYELDAKLNNLASQLNSSFLGFSLRRDFRAIFSLIKEIKLGLQIVKYPSKAEKDMAWQKLKELQADAIEQQNRQNDKWNDDWASVTQKIDKLDDLMKPRFFETSKKWGEIFPLIKEIKEDLKNTQSPSKEEKDNAWQQFKNLKVQAESESQSEKNELAKELYYYVKGKLHDAEAVSLLEDLGYMATVFLTGGLSVLAFGDKMTYDREQMILRAKYLKEARNAFYPKKYLLAEEERDELESMILETQKDHDKFWDNYNEQKRLQQEAFEKSKKERQEKREEMEYNYNEIQRNLERTISSTYNGKDLRIALLLIQDELKKTHLSKEQRQSLFELINEGFDKVKELNEAKQQAWLASQQEFLEKMQGRLSKQIAFRDKLENALDKQSSFLQSLKDRLYKQKEFKDRLESQLEDLDDKYSEARSDSYRDRIDEWRQEKKAKIESVEDDITEIERKIDEVEDTVESLPKKISEVEDDIEQLEDKVNSIKEKTGW